MERGSIHWSCLLIFRAIWDVRDDNKLFVCLPGTVQSMTGQSQSRLRFITEQLWYKLLRYELVNPTIEINLLYSSCLAVLEDSRRHSTFVTNRRHSSFVTIRPFVTNPTHCSFVTIRHKILWILRRMVLSSFVTNRRHCGFVTNRDFVVLWRMVYNTSTSWIILQDSETAGGIQDSEPPKNWEIALQTPRTDLLPSH